MCLPNLEGINLGPHLRAVGFGSQVLEGLSDRYKLASLRKPGKGYNMRQVFWEWKRVMVSVCRHNTDDKLGCAIE